MQKIGTEWRWLTKHSCGHQTNQAVQCGKRPVEIAKRLKLIACPKCKLMDLLSETYGDLASKDISAITANIQPNTVVD